MQTVAAIDAGSNAIRMVVGRVNNSQDQVEIIENIRIPVRLGQDVFSIGHIGEPSMQAALDTLKRKLVLFIWLLEKRLICSTKKLCSLILVEAVSK